MVSKDYYYRGLLMLLFMTAAAPRSFAADENVMTLMVKGEPVVINPAEHPVITYKSNTLYVKTETSSFGIPVSDISGGAFPKMVVHGDVNSDFSVDVADIASVISVMAGESSIGSAMEKAADVNGDGKVDVADIATVIDIMAGK